MTAIGLDAHAAGRTVRLSLGRYTTLENVDYAIECFRRAISACRPKAVGTSVCPGFSVAPQLTLDDLQIVRNQGFKAIICNRPDGEEPGQPTFSDIAEAAGRLGIEARYLPVVSGKIGEDALASFAECIETLPAPVLAYCRMGNRSSTLWNLSESRRKACRSNPVQPADVQ